MRASVIKTSITTISHRLNDFCRNQKQCDRDRCQQCSMMLAIAHTCLARRIDGIAKQALTGTRARPRELLNQLTSIVVETIEV
jgi:hypothetical protein